MQMLSLALLSNINNLLEGEKENPDFIFDVYDWNIGGILIRQHLYRIVYDHCTLKKIQAQKWIFCLDSIKDKKGTQFQIII